MVAYELLLLLDPEVAEEREEEILTRVRELVERSGGTWAGHDPWGRRKLAYEIGHKGDGVYHLVSFDARPETLEELSRILRITDGVMRHMATRRVAAPSRRPRKEAAVATREYAANTRSQEEE